MIIGITGAVCSGKQEFANYLETARPAYVVMFTQWSGFPGLDIVLTYIRRNGYKIEYSNNFINLFRRPD